MKFLALLFSLFSICSAEFYDIRYPIPQGYRVANATEWTQLYHALRIYFAEDPAAIPKFVRMAFHDVANFKADATSTGGRGCILYDFYANMSMNRGLMETRNVLLGNMIVYWSVNKVSFGWGDAIQLAGKAAIETAFPCISIAWSYGRAVCDGREKEGAPGPLMLNLASLNPFLTRYGMTATEMAILTSGAHGLAQAQNHFANSGINSFTEAFINSGIDWVAQTVRKPEPWVFFFTWFGLDLASFPFDPNFDPAHGDVPFITRGTLGRFNTDMMFFPSQISRSIPVLFTIPNATTDAADLAPLSAIETKLRNYMTRDPSVWETDFINAYVKMVLLGTAGRTMYPVYLSGIYPQCAGARKDLGHLTADRQLVANTHLGRITVPVNYTVTFSITPKGTTPYISNILHLTGTSNSVAPFNPVDAAPSGRVFAIYMNANALTLNVAFSTNSNWNENFNTPALTVNVKTIVAITVQNKVITVRYDGAVAFTRTLVGDRFFGLGNLYASNPWNPPANAIFGGYSLEKI